MGIAAVRDSLHITQKANDEMPYHSKEMQALMKHGNFVSGNASLGELKILNFWQQCVSAIDTANEHIYLLFVGRFFSVIIHDRVMTKNPLEMTMEAKATTERYRLILEQLQQSGL